MKSIKKGFKGIIKWIGGILRLFENFKLMFGK